MLQIYPHVKFQLAALGSITFVKPGCVHLKPNLGCIRRHRLVPPFFCLDFLAQKGGTCWGRGRRGRRMPTAGTQLVSQQEPEHSRGQCSGCKSTVEAAQVNVLRHRCSSLGLQPLSIKRPKPLSPTLSPTVTTNSASPYSKSDFVHNRSKALGTLQAQSGHFLPFSCNKEPFRLGLQNQTGLQEKLEPAVA